MVGWRLMGKAGRVDTWNFATHGLTPPPCSIKVTNYGNTIIHSLCVAKTVM